MAGVLESAAIEPQPVAMSAPLSAEDRRDRNNQPHFDIYQTVVAPSGEVYFSGSHRHTGVSKEVMWRWDGTEVTEVGTGSPGGPPVVTRDGAPVYLGEFEIDEFNSVGALYQGGQLVVREDQIPGATSAGGWRIDPAGYRVGDNGDLLVPAVDGVNRAILKTRPGGATTVLAKGGDAVPGLDGWVYRQGLAFHGMRINPFGDLVFRAQVQDGAGGLAEVVMRSAGGGPLRPLVRTGAGSPTVTRVSNPAINESRMTIYSVEYADFSSAVVVSRSGQPDEVLVATGVPTETNHGTVTFDDLHRVGERAEQLVFGFEDTILAVVSEADPVNPGLSRRALWRFRITDDGLESQRVGRAGLDAPRTEVLAVWQDFQAPVLTRSGRIVFVGVLEIPGSGSARSLWASDENGVVSPVAVSDYFLNTSYFYELPDGREAALGSLQFVGSGGGFDGVITGAGDLAEVTFVSEMEPADAELGPGLVVFTTSEPGVVERDNLFVWRDDAVTPYDWPIYGHWDDSEGTAVDTYPGEEPGDRARIDSTFVHPVQVDIFPTQLEIEGLTALNPGGVNFFSDFTATGVVEATALRVRELRPGEPATLGLRGEADGIDGVIGRLEIGDGGTVELGEGSSYTVGNLVVEEGGEIAGDGVVTLSGDAEIAWSEDFGRMPGIVNEAGKTLTVTAGGDNLAWRAAGEDSEIEVDGTVRLVDDGSEGDLQLWIEQSVSMRDGSTIETGFSAGSVALDLRGGVVFSGHSSIRLDHREGVANGVFTFWDPDGSRGGVVLEPGARVELSDHGREENRPRFVFDSEVEIGVGARLTAYRTLLECRRGISGGALFVRGSEFVLGGDIGSGVLPGSVTVMASENEAGSIRLSAVTLPARAEPARIHGMMLFDENLGLVEIATSNHLLLDGGQLELRISDCVFRIEPDTFLIDETARGGEISVGDRSSLGFASASAGEPVDVRVAVDLGVGESGQVVAGADTTVVLEREGAHLGADGVLESGSWTSAGVFDLAPAVEIEKIGERATVRLLEGGVIRRFGPTEIDGELMLTRGAELELPETAACRGSISVQWISTLRCLESLRIFGRCEIRADSSVVVQGRLENRGTVFVEHGDLHVDSMEVRDGGTVIVGGEGNGARLVATREIVFFPGSTLRNYREIQAEQLLVLGATMEGGGIHPPVNMEGSILSPGSSPGTFTVAGDFAQDGGSVLAVELGDGEAGVGYDRVVVSGEAVLAGTLALSPAEEGFLPVDGQGFDIVSAGSVSGRFDTVTSAFGPGWRFDVDYRATGVRVTAHAVAATGYEAWQVTRFTLGEIAGGVVAEPGADPDGDGLVNLGEFVFGSDPKRAEGQPLDLVRAPAGSFAFGWLEFPLLTGASGVALSVESSVDAKDWERRDDLVIEVEHGDGTGRGRVLLPGGEGEGTATFYRLRVEEL